MDQVNEYEQIAFEKLYRWTKARCAELERVESAEAQPLMRKALEALKKRELLRGYCLQELERARRTAVSQSFLRALQQGGPGGLPKPIDLHAHDPLRYLGDMLGCIHQLVASEAEFLRGLGIFDSNEKGDGIAVDDDWAILARIFDGLCDAFRIRV